MSKELVCSQDWYTSLLDDCQAIMTEAVFNSRWSLIEGYHQLGLRIREDSKKTSITKLIRDLATDMNTHERNLWYAVQFVDKFKTLDSIPEGKNASWSKIRRLLPAHSKFAEKQTRDLNEIAASIFRKHGVEDSRTIANNLMNLITEHEEEN